MVTTSYPAYLDTLKQESIPTNAWITAGKIAFFQAILVEKGRRLLCRLALGKCRNIQTSACAEERNSGEACLPPLRLLTSLE